MIRPPTLSNRWAVLALLCFARISCGVHFQSVAPVSPFLMKDLSLNYGQLGLLIGLFMLPGSFLALPGGMLGGRFGDKTVVLVGLGCLTAGALILAMSGSFPAAFAGRLLGGIGLVLINVLLTKITTDWFSGKEIATAMGLLLATWPLGLALSLSGMGLIASALSWRAAFVSAAAYSALALVLVLVLLDGASHRVMPGASHRNIPGSAHRNIPGAVQSRRLWNLQPGEFSKLIASGMVWMFYNVGFIVFIGFAPALLISGGYAVALAGFLVGLASWISLGTLPLGGWLADRTGKSNLLIAGGAAACAVAMWGIGSTGPEPAIGPWIWIALLGVVFGLPAGAIMALPGQVLHPQSRGTGLGVHYTVFYVGAAMLQPVAGFLQDFTGSATTAVLFGGLMMALTLPSLALFRMLQGRTPAT